MCFSFTQGAVMKKYNIFVITSIAWSSFLALGPLGCSGGGGSAAKIDQGPEHAHIGQAAAHIVNYLSQPENRQRHPADTSEMKDWAAKNKIPEDDLVSTRDHEPYQIHQLNRGALTIITETTGVKGKKYMYTHGQGRAGGPGGIEVTQDEIDNALKAPSAGKRGGRPG
jgi:hypothetical protein